MSTPRAVFVFGQTGCPHCAEYIPRFKRLAASYRVSFPIGVYDLAKDQHGQEFAERLGGVRVVPTTVVMNHRGGIQKLPGALSNAQITALLRGT